MAVGADTVGYRLNLPHLENSGKTCFVTFCTFQRRILPAAARSIALESLVHDHRLKYWLDSAVVMPDHVHLVVMPYEFHLYTLLQAMKGASSHRIRHLGILKPPVWQDESFDHILRNHESARSKGEYLCNNSVRKGLVATPEEWPWLWRSWIEGTAGEGACRHTGSLSGS